MDKGRRFGRNEDQRHTQTRTERVESRGETARTDAANASTPEEQQRHESQAGACDRMADVHRRLNGEQS